MSLKNSKFLLPHDITGNSESKNLIVFLHGYPDTCILWNQITSQLENDNYVLNISYPNYDKRVQEKWGRSPSDIVKGIKDTIDLTKNNKDYKVFVVSHDWGANYTYLFDYNYPNVIKDGVVMDIGYRLDNSLKAKTISILYQFYLALSFTVPKPLGNEMTKFLMERMSKEYIPKNEIDASMNYPYYYDYKDALYQSLFFLTFFSLSRTRFTKFLFMAFLAGFLGYKLYNADDSNPLKDYSPSFPLAFMYGKKKEFMFHSEEVIRSLEARDKCEVFAMDNGHWLMMGNEDKIVKIINRRLKDN